MTHEKTESRACARDTLFEFKGRADARLRDLSSQWLARTLPGNSTPKPQDMVEAVIELTRRGGKRVRPALAYYAACCFDHSLDDTVLLEATLSVELLQTYLLIHDDVMDDDPERRGGPAVHVVLSRLVGDEVTGRSLAILAGDLGCALAQELLLHPLIPRDRSLAAVRELVQMQWEVIQGQLLDITAGASPLEIHDAKTSSYTTRGPVRLGAALAGASDEQIELMARYGTPLGQAFQVRDDLLGTFGQSSATGKPVGSDLRAGKRTALIEEALDQANSSQKEVILSALGDGAASDEKITAACQAIEETGAKKHNEELIERLTTESLTALEEAINEAKLQERGWSFLRGVALLLAERDR